jgi:hypothetical protein
MDFHWEREWRVRGDFTFSREDVLFVMCPEPEHARIEAEYGRPCLDVRWSAGKIIAKVGADPREEWIRRDFDMFG